MDGTVYLRAHSTEDGKEFWSVDTVRAYKTVNGVAAKGGSMGGPGPTVADGMLYVALGVVGVSDGMPETCCWPFRSSCGNSSWSIGMRVRLSLPAMAAALVAVSWFTIPMTGQQTASVSNCPSGKRDRPWMDTTLSPECRAQLALAAMTPDERLAFRGTNERLGLLAPGGSDGPNGIRAGGLTIEQPPVTSGRSANATAFPNVIALGATWDRELARRFGEAVGEEFNGKGMASVTGPTINLLRTWHWGRTAETFSEDPYLMSELVVPEVNGIQSRRVIAVAKHFAGNNQENTRTGVAPENAGVDEPISEKALDEIYFPHFKALAARACNGSVMCAYNQRKPGSCSSTRWAGLRWRADGRCDAPD